MRAGTFVKQNTGSLAYKAFIPNPLPPDPDLQIDAELSRILSDADVALGRLDGIASVLPNPDLFVVMFVRQEAVLSSQIEGTQSTLEDVLEFETGAANDTEPKDVGDIVNYIRAMNYGLMRLPELPLSLRLIKEIHAELMSGVRGGEKTPGEFRRSQNWIGGGNCTLATASFVPPPVHELTPALGDFEKFLHQRDVYPPLVHCGLAHAQFETIHPFLDGNGRIARLLITFLLCEQDILKRPLLYLSLFLKQNTSEYYDRLMAIRLKGDWEGWLKFFLRGVRDVSQSAIETARKIIALREEHRRLVAEHIPKNATAMRLHDFFFESPVASVRMAEERLKCSYGTVNGLFKTFARIGIIQQTSSTERNRRYRYKSYLDLFSQSKPSGAAEP